VVELPADLVVEVDLAPYEAGRDNRTDFVWFAVMNEEVALRTMRVIRSARINFLIWI
jgi:hypothetical protein